MLYDVFVLVVSGGLAWGLYDALQNPPQGRTVSSNPWQAFTLTLMVVLCCVMVVVVIDGKTQDFMCGVVKNGCLPLNPGDAAKNVDPSTFSSWQSMVQLAVALNVSITAFIGFRNQARARRVQLFREFSDMVLADWRRLAAHRDAETDLLILDGRCDPDLTDDVEREHNFVLADRMKNGVSVDQRLWAEECADISGYVAFGIITLCGFIVLAKFSIDPSIKITKFQAYYIVFLYVPFVAGVLAGLDGWRMERRRQVDIEARMKAWRRIVRLFP